MKKFVKAFLTMAMCFSMLSSNALAAESEIPGLSVLADEYISVSVSNTEIVYSNLQEFYVAAKEEIPAISDIELAEYVMDYTGQSYDGLSDETILETLDFTEISTVEQIFRAKEDGTVEELTPEEVEILLEYSDISPAASWESDDGYIQITTTASKGTKGSNGTPFTLSGTATWLKYPAFRFTDTFAIVYGGTFDDSYVITSTFSETGKCSECGKTFRWNGTEKYGPETNNQNPHFIESSDLIELDFAQSHAIGTKCDLKTISCMHLAGLGTPVNFAETTKLTSTIRFRVLTSDTTEARAAYAHTKLSGKITIGGSVSASGVTPTFSGVLDIIYSKYTAAPVTLRAN